MYATLPTTRKHVEKLKCKHILWKSDSIIPRWPQCHLTIPKESFYFPPCGFNLHYILPELQGCLATGSQIVTLNLSSTFILQHELCACCLSSVSWVDSTQRTALEKSITHILHQNNSLAADSWESEAILQETVNIIFCYGSSAFSWFSFFFSFSSFNDKH